MKLKSKLIFPIILIAAALVLPMIQSNASHEVADKVITSSVKEGKVTL
ncbi:hypothetical protein P8815_17980 [Bacillus altitudinis]|nr:hypothetical protein [Bacillus altitudinis]MEC0473629.1 hypothetical protein [Bacillus altitudinis]